MGASNTSSSNWLDATLTISGFVFGLIGVAALIWKDTLTILAVAFGASFMLASGLCIITRRQSNRINELEIDLKEARRQAGEWSATSNNIAAAIRAMYELAAVAPPAPARRTRNRQQGERNDNE